MKKKLIIVIFFITILSSFGMTTWMSFEKGVMCQYNLDLTGRYTISKTLLTYTALENEHWNFDYYDKQKVYVILKDMSDSEEKIKLSAILRCSSTESSVNIKLTEQLKEFLRKKEGHNVMCDIYDTNNKLLYFLPAINLTGITSTLKEINK